MNQPPMPPRRIRFRSKQVWRCGAGDPASDRVLAVAHERWSADFCASNHAPGCHGAFQVLHGRGWFLDGHGCVLLAPGSVIWYAPDRHRAFWCDPDAPLDVIILTAQGPGWTAAAERCLGQLGGAWQLRHPDPALRLLRHLQECCANGGPDAGEQAGHLLHAWLLQVRHEGLSQGLVGADRALWWRSRSLLQQGVVDSIAALAAELGVSPSYLARLYRRFDTHTAREQLLRSRLAGAQIALAEQETSIAAIAQDAGFADQSAFGKAFRRVAGCTPAAYRRRNRR